MGLHKFIKNIQKSLENMSLWRYTVLIDKNNYKLNIYHKLRAIRYGFSSDFYHMYNLEKNNPHDYISEYKRILSRNINEKYKVIFDNKVIFEQIIGKYLNVPQNIAIIFNKMYDKNMNIITKESLSKILKDEKYIIKPVADTGGGKGVEVIYRLDNNQYLFHNRKMDINDLYNELLKNNGYIINEYIKQHEYSAKINENSVNTIRIITIKEPKTEDFIIPCAVHRFGSIKSGIVDNVSSGGYVSMINVENGIIGETAYDTDVKFTDKHPDTNVQIKGTKIPRWNEITEKILETAKKFPYIPFIAWDVVITKDDYCVIEANASTSLELFQVFSSLKGTKLGEFYEYYGYLK